MIIGKFSQPKLIQTFLLNGTFEGPRIIDIDSSVKAFVIPRLHLGSVKDRKELLHPALYFLINSDDSKIYIGESENFYNRIKNHDQEKKWWDVAVAIVSTTNSLGKSEVKYLESLAVERAQGGSMSVENKTAPIRNNVHEFKLHQLHHILDDTQLILTSIGYDALSVPENSEQIWYCKTKKTGARGVFRGDKFVVLAGSKIDLAQAPSFAKYFPADSIRRNDIINNDTTIYGDMAILNENISFRSPNDAGQFATGRSINAWTTWKNEAGQTMDEIMRRGE